MAGRSLPSQVPVELLDTDIIIDFSILTTKPEVNELLSQLDVTTTALKLLISTAPSVTDSSVQNPAKVDDIKDVWASWRAEAEVVFWTKIQILPIEPGTLDVVTCDTADRMIGEVDELDAARSEHWASFAAGYDEWEQLCEDSADGFDPDRYNDVLERMILACIEFRKAYSHFLVQLKDGLAGLSVL